MKKSLLKYIFLTLFIILSIVVGVIATINQTDSTLSVSKEVCDFDGNGVVDVIDVLQIKQIQAGLIEAPQSFDLNGCVQSLGANGESK